MAIENAPTPKGKESARGLHKAARAEEREVEADKGLRTSQRARIALRSALRALMERAQAKSSGESMGRSTFCERPLGLGR